jgi:hypothetical protein
MDFQNHPSTKLAPRGLGYPAGPSPGDLATGKPIQLSVLVRNPEKFL